MAEPDEKAGNLTVTVCVSPLRRLGRKNVERELAQVRSALLYADHVRLVSTTVAMLETFRPLLGISASDSSMWDDIRRLPDHTLQRMFSTQKVKPIRKDLARVAQLPRHDHRRTQLESRMLPDVQAALKEAEILYDKMRTPELDLARDKGALTVETERFELEDPDAVHTEWFRSRLLEAWQDPVGTALLDDRAQKVLRSTEARTHLPAALGRAKRAATGSGLVKHLPTFPKAPMADVLEVRGELADGRRQYRTVVRELSDRLASSALDPTLSSEVTELWHDGVEPVLEEMRRTVTLSGLARATARGLVGDLPSGLKSGGVLSVSIAALQGGADSPLSLLGAAGAGGYLVGTALQEALDERKRHQAHEFVYLTNADKGLKALQRRRS